MKKRYVVHAMYRFAPRGENFGCMFKWTARRKVLELKRWLKYWKITVEDTKTGKIIFLMER